jgi:hypothetical protein
LRLNVVLFVLGEIWLYLGLALWSPALAFVVMGLQAIALGVLREEPGLIRKKTSHAPTD